MDLFVDMAPALALGVLALLFGAAVVRAVLYIKHERTGRRGRNWLRKAKKPFWH